MADKILVCQNISCTSLGSASLVRDIEELAQGRCAVEEWGCLGKCGKGPNVQVDWKGGKTKVTQGVKSFKDAMKIVKDQAEVDVSESAKKIGKLKFDIRRDEDAGSRMEKIKKAFDAIGGEDSKSEPKLLSELLVLRSKEFLKTQAEEAWKDALKACELVANWAQPRLALGNACEASGRIADGVKAVQEALEIGKGINKGAVKRMLTRMERKLAAGPQEGDPAPAPAPAAAAPEPAPAPTPEPAPEPKKEAAPKKSAAKGPSKKTDKETEKDKTKKHSGKKDDGKKDADKKDAKKDAGKKAKEDDVQFVQRSPLDFIEWKVASTVPLNHNCILLEMKSINMDTTSRDVDPGDLWHVDLLKEGDVGKEEVKRAYTPISKFPAYRQGTLEFMVKIYQDGMLTPYLSELKVGDNLLVSPPYVTESLEGYRDMVVIAGGSAVTVAIQLCEAQLKRYPRDVNVDMIMCNSNAEDVLYQDVFDWMLDQYPSFRMVHCITGKVPSWPNSKAEIHNGRICKEVLKINKPGTKGIVSGPRGLCRAATDLWAALGQDPENLIALDEVGAQPEAIVETEAKDKEDAHEEVVRKNSKDGLYIDKASTNGIATEAADAEKTAPAMLETKPLEETPAAIVQADPSPSKVTTPAELQPVGFGLFGSLFRTCCSQSGKQLDGDDGEGVPAVRSVGN